LAADGSGKSAALRIQAGKVKLVSLKEVLFSFPTLEHPFYHVKAFIDLEASKLYTIERVFVNSVETRDFFVYNNEKLALGNAAKADAKAAIVVKADWENGSMNQLRMEGVVEDGGKVTVEESSIAPAQGGYWNKAWRYYTSVVLTESRGMPRESEPVHMALSVYSDRVDDPVREIRVVSLDPRNGEPREVMSQVYDVSSWSGRSDERLQPTMTFDVAFLADVPANSSKVYLIFYGNRDAPEPHYESDLSVSGNGLGLTVENSFYKIRLQETSGAVDEVHMKMGVNKTFDHHLETNGAVHWNPDVYAPPRQWIHASDWKPSPSYTVIQGPVFLMTTRSGPLPQYPEVNVSVTYVFYAKNPHVMIFTSLEVSKDIYVQAIRNGEFVFNHNIFKEFAWKKVDGGVGSMVVVEGARHPKHAVEIEADTPWVALYNVDYACGFGVSYLEFSRINRSGGLVRAEVPYIYLAWGPWIYFARPLSYTFGSSNPQRMVKIPSGSLYYEKMAFQPFNLLPGREDRFKLIEQQDIKLRNPLGITAWMDIDERVPRQWVPPILVAEFKEV